MEYIEVGGRGGELMAHTFDTSLRFPASGTSTTNPLSTSFTCGAGTTVLVVMLNYAGGSDRAGGAPTYNGLSLTQADQNRRGTTNPEGTAELWYLLNPPTGAAYTVSVPNSGGVAMSMVIASAISASGASALDVTNGGGGVSANPSVSVDTTVNGDVIFAVVVDGAQSWAPTGRTGTQLYDTDNGAWGGGAQYLLQTSAGTQAMGWTFGTSEDWGLVVAAFKEATPTQTITPPGFEDTETFGTPSISVGSVTTSPDGIGSVEVFGTANINLVVFPSGVLSSELFGIAEVQATNPTQSLTPEGISSLGAFGNANLQPGAVTANPEGITSAESFGAVQVAPQAVVVIPTGISSSESHATANIVQSGYDVYEGRGRFQVATSGSGVRATANAANQFNVEASLNFQFGDINSQALFRAYIRSSGDWVNTDTPSRAYELVVNNTGGYVVNRIEGGVRTEIGTGSWLASTSLQYVRFATINNVIQVKIWETTEPEWQLTIDDSLNGLEESGTLQLGLFSVTGAHVLYVDDVLYDYASLENSILPQAIGTAEAFGALSVVPQAITLIVSGIPTSEAFGNSGLNLGVVAGGVPSGENFGVPQLLPGSVSVSAMGIPSQESIGLLTIVVGAETIQPVGVDTGEAFGVTQVLPQHVDISTTSIVSGEAFGLPTVQVGSVQVIPESILGQGEVGAPILTVGSTTVSPVGILSGESFGETVVNAGGSSIYVSGISTSENFGVLVLAVGQAGIQPQGISSSESFGTPKLTIFVAPLQVTPIDGVGVPSILALVQIPGINSQEDVGGQQVLPGQVILGISGVGSQEAVGVPAVIVGETQVSVSGIPGMEEFGQATLHTFVNVEPAGVLSSELFGAPTVVPGASTIGVLSMESQEALGVPGIFMNMQIVGAQGTDTGEQFGVPLLVMDWGEVIFLVLHLQKTVSGVMEIQEKVPGVLTIRKNDTNDISFSNVTETIVVMEKLESILKI